MYVSVCERNIMYVSVCERDIVCVCLRGLKDCLFVLLFDMFYG